MDNESVGDAPACPYCSSPDGCSHVLLIVDRTFRTAEGGALRDAFNNRWNELRADGADDFDESEPFEGLLEAADACADFSIDYDLEGGPGMSSSYSIYFVESVDGIEGALVRFVNGGGQ